MIVADYHHSRRCHLDQQTDRTRLGFATERSFDRPVRDLRSHQGDRRYHRSSSMSFLNALDSYRCHRCSFDCSSSLSCLSNCLSGCCVDLDHRRHSCCGRGHCYFHFRYFRESVDRLVRDLLEHVPMIQPYNVVPLNLYGPVPMTAD